MLCTNACLFILKHDQTDEHNAYCTISCVSLACHVVFKEVCQIDAFTFFHCALGASFFYQPGSVSYEAHEVRAFGLLLKDLVTRTRRKVADDSPGESSCPDQGSHGVLQHVVSLCTGNEVTAAQRPSFSQVYAHLQE